ncbi:hypothetical protein [Thiocapsa bogorovii]|uniref:hypothetical protein n=1 Tax=Thiocapsa bogorovii TaxID=521689 RepID=UPI001E5FE112|nr:hypothetical protein [Thiocapsa bogorovii]UHD16738.1 hypothetical protein LT988_01350 [Thiocapsa bogorovii]
MTPIRKPAAWALCTGAHAVSLGTLLSKHRAGHGFAVDPDFLQVAESIAALNPRASPAEVRRSA